MRTRRLTFSPRDESGFTSSTVDGDVPRFWGANIVNYGVERFYKVFALCAGEGA